SPPRPAPPRAAPLLPYTTLFRSDGAELIVLDPPRSGAGAEVARAVAAAARGPVIHIGCDPAAFARDLGLYRREGMAVQGLRAFRSEEHTSELQSRFDLVCRLLLE